MPFYLGENMLRFWAISTTVLTLAGCSVTDSFLKTTENTLNFSHTKTPIELVLEKQPMLKTNLHNFEIQQVFNRVEAPTAAQITVLETGLTDDSIKAIRHVYRFKQVEQTWKMLDQQVSYQCVRGKTTAFQTQNCL